MNNSKKISKVKCPVLIAHSTEDNLIPFGCAEENFKNISHLNKILIPIRGGHINPKIDPKNGVKSLIEWVTPSSKIMTSAHPTIAIKVCSINPMA